MSLLRIGIAGTGGMGGNHARILSARPDVELVALFDTDPVAMNRLEKSLGMAVQGLNHYASLESMIEEEKLDAIVIATPHTCHADRVRVSLKSGLHVLVEKPMATTTKDARDFIAYSEKANKVLSIACLRHGDGKFIKARELIKADAIGDVRLIHVIIAQDCLRIFTPGASWRADPQLSGGGHFMDTGSHINDILLWTTGLEPETVHAFINSEGTLVDVNTAISVKFTNGAVGNLSYTSMSPEWREEFTFYGTKGVMRFGASESLLLNQKGKDIVLPLTPSKGQSPADNFVEAIHGREEVQAPAICGLRVVQLTEAAYKSGESGNPEKVG